MRHVLTGLALLLIAALTAALVAPLFVDWTGQRREVERRIAAALGAPVALNGPLRIRLLPTPRLEAGEVETQSADGALRLTARAAHFELAIASLLRGEWRFTEARLEGPEFHIVASADGEVRLPRLADLPPDARIERLTIDDGRIVVERPGSAPLVVSGIAFDGEAASLAGPYKGAGSADIGGETARFRFSSGALGADRLNLKFVGEEAGRLPKLEFDGAVVAFAGGKGERLSLEGQLTLGGPLAPKTPWRAVGALRADAAGARLDDLELRLGGDDKALALTGRASLALKGDRRGALELGARQLDLDRLLADPPTADALGALAASLAAGRSAPIPLSLDLRPALVALAGETLVEPTLTIEAAPGAPARLRFDIGLPGRGRVAFDGRFEPGAAAALTGRVEATTRDAGQSRDYLRAVATTLKLAWPAMLDGAPPARSIDLAARLDASAVSLALRDLALTLDRSRFSGAAVYTAAVAGARSRFYANLTSDALDVDEAPALRWPSTGGEGPDLDLELDARTTRVARFGEGALETGRVRMKLTRAGDVVTLERLSLAGPGGATLSASGLADPAGARFDVDLDAARLDELAVLLRRLAPGPATDLLVGRAGELSPARLTLKARLGRAEPRTTTIEGALGATRVLGAAEGFDATGAPTALSLTLDAADAAVLLRQLGLPATGAPGPGHVEIAAERDGDGRHRVDVHARLAGANLTFAGHGDLAPLLAVRPPGLDGEAALEAADLAPLWRALGLGGDGAARFGVDLAGRLKLAAGRLTVEKLRGWAATTHLSGKLGWGPGEGVSGALSIDRLAAADLLAFALGRPPRAAAEGPWPEQRLGPPLAEFPPGAALLSVARFDLGPLGLAEDARMSVAARPGVLAIESFSARLAGQGEASGRLTLRRAGAAAALAGALAASGAALDQPWLRAEVSGELDFATSGGSYAALLGGLAGKGEARLTGATLPHNESFALERALAAAQAATEHGEDGLRRFLARELDLGATGLGDVAATANLAAGALRVVLPERTLGQIRVAAQGTLDLRAMTIAARVAMTSLVAPRLWAGEPPRLDIRHEGPLAAPIREIDVSALSGGLSSLAIARDLERLEALEADIRERAFFNRRLKAIDFMRRREAEIAAFEALEAKRAEEERKRLEDEARGRAAEAARAELARQKAAERAEP